MDFASAGFYVNHFVKDLGIALEECRNMDLALPGLALVSCFPISFVFCAFPSVWRLQENNGDGKRLTNMIIYTVYFVHSLRHDVC